MFEHMKDFTFKRFLAGENHSSVAKITFNDNVGSLFINFSEQMQSMNIRIYIKW